MERDWVGYERDLNARKRKVADFFLVGPTRGQLEDELHRMNEGKEGPPFQIPKTIILYFHFFKQRTGMDDRLLVMFLSGFMAKTMGTSKEFCHSAIVRRRQKMDLDIPFDIKPGSLDGKTLYLDGMCLRVGRGGYYCSKRYHTEVKYLRIMLFTDDSDKVVDFVIGDENDAEVNLAREKMPQIKESKAKAMVGDGAFAAHDIVSDLEQNNIKAIIRASEPTVASMDTKPPPNLWMKEGKIEDRIWDQFARAQTDYQKWRKETGYSMRWPHSEGRISAFKRMHGEAVVSRTQKALHDEVAAKLMLLDGVMPCFWA
ncbi:MAG: transposase [Candidatus Micrarchaeota archaeon]